MGAVVFDLNTYFIPVMDAGLAGAGTWWWAGGLLALILGFLAGWWLQQRKLNRLSVETRRYREHFNWLFEQSPIGMSLTSLDGRYLEVNQALCDLLGYTRDELLSMHFAELSHPDDLPANMMLVERLRRGEQSHFQMEKRYFNRRGEIIYTLLQVTLARTSDGKPSHMISQVVNITRRKLAEQALQASEVRLMGIIQSAMDAIVTVDEAQRIVLFNDAAEKMFGYRRAEVLGQPLDILMPETAQIPHRQHVARFGKQGITRRHMSPSGEIWGRRASGQTFPLEASISTLSVNGQRFFTAILRDISEQKRVQEYLNLHRQEVERQRAFLREVIDSLPGFIFVKDDQHRYLLVNKTLADFFRTTPPALIGRTDAGFGPQPDEIEQFIASDRRVLETGQEVVIPEDKITDLSGEVHWLHTVKRPLFDAQGRVNRVLGVSVDITARKLLEDRLRQSQKMEAIGRLAGGIAHDFNNLLTVLIGSVELLLARHPAGDEDYAELSRIKKAADRAAALTRQLLAFSRRQVLQPRVVSPNEVISGLIPMLERLLGEDITLDCHLHPQTGCIKIDPVQLEQAVMNLAINARDAMPTGGVLTIQTEPADLTPYTRPYPDLPPGRYVRLTVRDTGHGIEKESLAHIFEPFFTTKPVGQGTGLGLAVVHGVVQQSQGHIYVESSPDEGTVFTLFFPAVALPATPEAQPESTSSPAGSETLLLVEDEELLRHLVRKVLAERGYRVLAAANAAEALEVVQRHADGIDLAVVDIVLPDGMSGPELVQNLRQTHPALKVLFISGHPQKIAGLQRTGNVSSLQKPFTAQVLAQTVRDMLDNGRPGLGMSADNVPPDLPASA